MNITIVGAGNVGTQLAVHCAEKGHKVIIYGSKPEKINKELTVIDENDIITHKGIIEKATSNEKEAFADAEVIFITMPATMMKTNAKKIEPFVKPGMKIGIIPGTGGGECAFSECLRKGAIVFGLQRVPSVARLVEYGKVVRAVGYRNELFVSALPNSATNECCDIVEHLVGTKTTPLPNYLNITLTPSNPILHTTRIRALFEDWKEGQVYRSVPLFYEEWSDRASELLIKCDDEVQKICSKLEMFDLSYVKSLKVHYESYSIEEMTNKIRSIIGFKGLTSPVVEVNGGYAPDFSSRYFLADFPYGLAILVQVANLIALQVPDMESTLNWYYDLVGNKEEFRYADYGIKSLEDFIRFYSS